MTYRLLGYGIYSSLFYIGMNIVVPLYFDGYSYRNHTVSELYLRAQRILAAHALARSDANPYRYTVAVNPG